MSATVVAIDLDLSDLPGEVATRMTRCLPEPIRSRTEWTYCGQGSHAYTSKSFHVLPDGRTVIVAKVATLSELMGDDWRYVAGLTADEWDDYCAQMRERGMWIEGEVR